MGKAEKEIIKRRWREVQVQASACYLVNILYELEGLDRDFEKGEAISFYNEATNEINNWS